MAEKAVIDAVKARLGDTWSGLPVVIPGGAAETPSDASAYLLVQFPVSSTARISVNQRSYREEGGFRIVINESSGSDALNSLMLKAEQLVALFRDQKFGGIQTQVPSSPYIDDDNENGNYYSAAIVIPYTYNF